LLEIVRDDLVLSRAVFRQERFHPCGVAVVKPIDLIELSRLGPLSSRYDDHLDRAGEQQIPAPQAYR
jgi:hypothetical protein